MKLILTRHGETEGNQQKIIQGHTPGKLSEKGITQATKLATRLMIEKIDIIYSSDLKRAADTAKIIAKYHNCPLHFVKELRERDYGRWTGQRSLKIDWNNPPNDAETYEHMQKRISNFLDKVYEKYFDKTIIFVAHGSIGMALISVVKNQPLNEEFYMNERLSNTSLNIFEINEDKNHKTHLLNSTTHLNYPTREQCLKFYKELGTPDNIIRHVVLVNKISIFLAKKLIKAGLDIDLELVDTVSLLHDLDKWICINDSNLRHGFKTEELLIEKGYPELGFIARQHRGDLILQGLNTWEEKILSYADKRVLHENIVSLDDRLKDINERYPSKDNKKREKEMELFYQLENEIFTKLDFKPVELSKYLP